MNKYLMMSAAALLSTTGGTVAANAHTVSFHFGPAGSGSYCDAGVTRNQGIFYAWVHNFTHACGFTHNSYGQGIAGKSKGFGKNVLLSDNYNYGQGRVCSYDLQLPITNGSKWALYCTSNGVTTTEVSSGVIILGLAKHQPGAAKTTASAVKDIIAKR